MISELPETGSPLTLSFKSHPKRPSRDVRACLAEGSLWFDAMDICGILGRRPEYVIPAFDRIALESDIAQFDFESECVPVVSPIGAWKIANSHDTPTSDVVSRWTKSEAARLAPDYPKDDARRVVTLNPDGTLAYVGPSCAAHFRRRRNVRLRKQAGHSELAGSLELRRGQ